MKHTIVLREEGRYNAFPVLHQLADGRLAIGCVSSPVGDHMAMGDWPVFESSDSGETWSRSDDPALPPNWPGNTPREQYDRLCGVLPDGTWMAVGSVGYECWNPIAGPRQRPGGCGSSRTTSSAGSSPESSWCRAIACR